MFSIFSKFRQSHRVKRSVSPKLSSSKIWLESLEDRAVPAIFWVSPTGNDAGAGTQADPFKTISHALDVTNLDVTKDTINILPGSYAEIMTGPADPFVVGAPTFTYGLYVAPTNPVVLQGVDAGGAPITNPGSVLATITAGAAVGGPVGADVYNVSNFAIYAPNTDLLGIKFDASVISNSHAPDTDLLALYGNNISVQNSVINSGVTDPMNPVQPVGTNSSSISIIDPTFTPSTTVSSITGYNINNNTITGGVLVSHGAGIGADRANLKITSNTITDGFFGNIAVYGNLNSPDDPFFIYDAALPTIGGPGVGNTLTSTDASPAWRQLVYFYTNPAIAPTKTQLDAIFAGNTIQDYAYATDSLGNPRITGNTASGGAPGDNNFYGFTVYNNLTQLSNVITDNPMNATVNWPVSSGNLVKYSVSSAGTGLINLTDLTVTPQGPTPSTYKLVLGTTPNGLGGSVDVRNITVGGTLATDIDGNAAGNTITGNSAANYIKGFAGTDTLNGLGGDDIFEGGSGNDAINGGAGVDRVILTGNFNNYSISYNTSTKVFSLNDNRPGSPDGKDAINNVEFFQFADITVPVVTIGSSFNTVALGLANAPVGGVVFIGSGSYNENISINQNVSLVGFGNVIINQATIGGNARLGSTTVNVQVKTVFINQIGGTQSRPTDATLISVAATSFANATTVTYSGDPAGATNALKAGVFSTGANLYRRIIQVGSPVGGTKTALGAGTTLYTPITAGQVLPTGLTFTGGVTLKSFAPTVPTPPSDGVYQLPSYA